MNANAIPFRTEDFDDFMFFYPPIVPYRPPLPLITFYSQPSNNPVARECKQATNNNNNNNTHNQQAHNAVIVVSSQELLLLHYLISLPCLSIMQSNAQEFFVVQKCWFDGPHVEPAVDYMALFTNRAKAEETAYQSAHVHAKNHQAVVRTLLM